VGRPSTDAANQKDRIDRPLHILEPALGKEREQPSLALNFQLATVGCDLKRIDLPSRQAIGRAEDLHRTDEVQLFDRRDNGDDDSPPPDRNPCSRPFAMVRHSSFVNMQ
jgi:hypothetical protein